MKKIFVPAVVLALFCAAGAHASSPFRGGGGGQPDPFDYNAHFELADDEYYILSGRIVLGPAMSSGGRIQAFLKVDLADQGWLANAYRVSVRGLYPIEGSVGPWRHAEHSAVKLAVRARVHVSADTRRPVVSLKVIPELSDMP